MDVSVIMINYNTEELTRNAINSIFACTEGLSYEIILIDNLSPDGSGEKLSREFGEKIVFLQSGGNLGTSKAFNLGLKHAVGKYILWLNSDILFKENFIGKLFAYMEQNSDCGICGGNLLNFEGKPMHSFRRRLPSLKTDRADLSIFRRIGRKLFKRRSEEYNYTNRPLEVGYITGADMMVRREVFDQIGGFDEDIFMYAEECEFTFRMKQNTDYKVISLPDAKMYHLEGASFGGKTVFGERRFRVSLAGNTVYMTKCYGSETAKKYLRQHARAYRRFMRICRVLFKKNQYEVYKKKREIAMGFLENYPAFMSVSYESNSNRA